MFFEGSEKKVEVILKPGMQSLRSHPRPFWNQVVVEAEAEILSVICNEYCDAYLLSESSLFVWHDRFLMLTCGTTTLVDAVLLFLDQYDMEQVDYISYQRKNEYQPHLQKTSFEADLIRLRERFSGTGYLLGHLDSHHNYIFHLDKPYHPKPEDTTTEFLMYHIRGDSADYLRSEGQSAKGVRDALSLEQSLPGFLISDWLFEPFGYSMNAIRGDRYATMHITPQENSSYVSFETNLDLSGANHIVLQRMLDTLNPGSWDLIGFNSSPAIIENDNTRLICSSHINLSCGYNMIFRHYQQQQQQQQHTLAKAMVI